MLKFIFGLFAGNQTIVLIAILILVGIYLLYQFSRKYKVRINFRSFIYDSPNLKVNTDLPTYQSTIPMPKFNVPNVTITPKTPVSPTPASPTPASPTLASPTLASPTPASPTPASPTTASPTTASPTTSAPSVTSVSPPPGMVVYTSPIPERNVYTTIPTIKITARKKWIN